MPTKQKQRRTVAAPSPRQKAKTVTIGMVTDAAEAPYEAISATIPSTIVREAKRRHPKGRFSEFVARAIARELVREGQDAFLQHAESDAPADGTAFREFLTLLTS